MLSANQSHLRGNNKTRATYLFFEIFSAFVFFIDDSDTQMRMQPIVLGGRTATKIRQHRNIQSRAEKLTLERIHNQITGKKTKPTRDDIPNT